MNKTQYYEEKIRLCIDHAMDAIVFMNSQGIITDWNPQSEKIFGWTKEEVVGKKMSETIIPHKYREAHERGLQHFLKTGQGRFINHRIELSALHRDGKEFPVELTVSSLRLDSDVIFSAFIRDITERKKAENEFRTVVEASPSAMILSNNEGIITMVNQRVEHLFGYTREELLGQPIEILLPDRFRFKHLEYRNRFLESPSPRPMGAGRDLFGLRKDGTEFPIEIGLNPIETPEGLRILASIIDITERKRSEAEIQKKTEELRDSNEELEQFASVVAHDLQEPLLKIIAFGDLITTRAASPLDEKSQDYLNRMKNAALRMRHLIDDLLAFSRLKKVNNPFEPVNLEGVLDRVLSDLEIRIKETQGKVEVKSLPIIMGDKVQMHQLFQNLISNALKYHNYELKPQVIVKSRMLENGFVEIRVEDNGIGFDEKYLDRIFKPFERLNPELDRQGTGMGLAICKKIVERHGGQITARSQVKQGSTFIIALPLA